LLDDKKELNISATREDRDTKKKDSTTSDRNSQMQFEEKSQ
jgi:hypothetical protein